jgi:hypothetical protein
MEKLKNYKVSVFLDNIKHLHAIYIYMRYTLCGKIAIWN